MVSDKRGFVSYDSGTWPYYVKILKTVRFIRMYGVYRTFYKVGGRLRSFDRLRIAANGPRRIVGMIGCGQFAFATIGYFLAREQKVGIAACFDIDPVAAASYSKFHGGPKIVGSAAAVLSDPAVTTVYIASNHASHADYACSALAHGHSVYVEKPVAVSLGQLARLHAAARRDGARIFAGYNRPFSGAVQDLRREIGAREKPLTLACFISGHVLSEDHWYRRKGEGTRICGNVGHWLDLAVHILSWGELPDRWRIQLTWSNAEARDDDIAISLASDRGDLVSIVLTARTEPFEGINETINLQWGDAIAKIDDFRRMTIWKGSRLINRRYAPKDVGHGAAVGQPFAPKSRDWSEVERSTLLMLHIMGMVERAEATSHFSFVAARDAMEALASTLDQGSV